MIKVGDLVVLKQDPNYEYCMLTLCTRQQLIKVTTPMLVIDLMKDRQCLNNKDVFNAICLTEDCCVVERYVDINDETEAEPMQSLLVMPLSIPYHMIKNA